MSNNKQCFRLLAFSLLLIIIIGSSSFLNMALSKSSSHIPLLTSDGISINGRTVPSNINGAYKAQALSITWQKEITLTNRLFLSELIGGA